jgi:hypothetical protein
MFFSNKWREVTSRVLYHCRFLNINMIFVVRFQVLTAASMKFRVFWDILPCSQVDVVKSLSGVPLPPSSGRWVSLTRMIAGYMGVQVDWADQWGMVDDRWRERERGIVWEIWWMMMEAIRTSLKRRSTSTWLYGSISQKTLSFMIFVIRNWGKGYSIKSIE